MAKEFEYTSRNWFGKASAGAVLGLALAIGLTGVYSWVGPGGLAYGTSQPQFAMWMVGFIWPIVLSFCFFFRSGRAAWLWLGGATLLSFVGLFVVKLMFGGDV